MTDQTPEEYPNYEPSSPARVRFGPAPYQLVDLPVAERILRQLHDTYPALLGSLMAGALIGPEAVPQKRTRARSGG